MNGSDSIKEIASALSKALPDIDKADKNKENPHFRSKYADLGNVIDAIKPALEKHGLTFTQKCHEAENAAKVETIIIHSSGEWLSCGTVSVPVSKNDAQGYGSALTYARRYSLSAAFGVAPEDDDGNAAAKAAPKKPAPEKQPPSKPKTELSADQEKYFPQILETLTALFGDDRDKKIEGVKFFTAFTTSEGKEIPGVEDYRKLDGKRLQVLAHKLDAVLKKQEKGAAE